MSGNTRLAYGGLARKALLALASVAVASCSKGGPDGKMSTLADSARARFVAGPPQESNLMPMSQDSLRTADARRTAAWNVVAEVLKDVPLAHGPVTLPTVAKWQTWYGRESLNRTYRKVLPSQLSEGRRGDGPSLDAMRAAERWDANRLTTLPGWDEERVRSWLRHVNTNARSRGVFGTPRTLISPELARHLMSEGARISDCVARGWIVDESESSARTPCLGDTVPPGAVAIKALWQRADIGDPVPRFDTRGEDLRKIFQSGGGTWSPSGHEMALNLDPRFYNAEQVDEDGQSRSAYRLLALHVMTKQLRDWVWITLWWSADPDEDFGADRPLSISSPWRHYKMCVVTDFQGNSSDEGLESGAQVPASLRDAQEAIRENVGDSSWCSNPYLELGAKNMATNCIGCHQHAGTDLSSDIILEGAPGSSNGRVRDVFPTDYLWSIRSAPEAYGMLIHDAREQTHVRQ